MPGIVGVGVETALPDVEVADEVVVGVADVVTDPLEPDETPMQTYSPRSRYWQEDPTAGFQA